MEQEHLYIGIRRDGVWRVRPVAELTEHELDGVNILRDVLCASTIGPDLDAAVRQVLLQADRGVGPFFALEPVRRGLHVLFECITRANGRAPLRRAAEVPAPRRHVRDAAPRQASTERESTDDRLRVERVEVDLASDEELNVIHATADAVVRGALERADAVRSMPGSEPLTDHLLEEWRARAGARRVEHAARLSEHRTGTDESLLRERARFDEMLAARDEALAIAGHELRNMVAGAIGFAAVIAKEAREKGYPALLKPARNIERAGARMQRLIGDLVDVASITAGRLEVRREVGDLTKVVDEAVDAFEAHACACDVSLSVDLIQPLPLVLLDPARVLQVLVNLLGNALKFTPPGGRVSIRVERRGRDVRCAVTDSGPGVPKDMLDAIFDQYRQVVRGDHRGLGLGLYIAKHIVQKHDGRIWAQSELGRGTTLVVALPAA